MKQVIVVNESLRLPRGKLAAQVAHGAVAAFLVAGNEARRGWLDQGMPKVVLKADDAASLVELAGSAERRQVPAALIRDAGKTVLPAGTVTCLGLGPAAEKLIDELTGELKLLR
jgi:PTH2 family peptidyl-tRNA hydrolase